MVLEDHGHVPVPRRHSGQRFSVQPDNALVGRFQAGDQAQGGGLAAAGRADDDQELVVLDGEMQTGDGADDFTSGAGEAVWTRSREPGEP